MTKLTPALRRALEAVERGEVRRLYRQHGNVLKGPKGVGSAALWKLDGLRLLEDGPSMSAGVMQSTAKQVLTKAGTEALGK